MGEKRTAAAAIRKAQKMGFVRPDSYGSTNFEFCLIRNECPMRASTNLVMPLSVSLSAKQRADKLSCLTWELEGLCLPYQKREKLDFHTQMNHTWFIPLPGIVPLNVNNYVFTVQEKRWKIPNSASLAISYNVQSANSDFAPKMDTGR